MPAPPTSNKQAMQSAYADAQSEQGPNVTPEGGPGGGLNPQELVLRVEHLTNLLISKGIISPQEVISPPVLGAPAPGGPVPGGLPPGGPPPGGPPMGGPAAPPFA